MNNDEKDYIAMLERTQIPEDHPLILYLDYSINVNSEHNNAFICGHEVVDWTKYPIKS